MQQAEPDNLLLISQGNNSFIHRLFNSSGQIVNKSILHDYTIQQSQTNIIEQHQMECKDLLNEYTILSQLDHPHIIKPISFNDDNIIYCRNQHRKCCTLLMESALCDSYQLCKESRDYFDIKTILNFIQQTGSALQYIHSKDISHNDVKLENILIFNRNLAKLADFGFSNKNQDQINVQKWQIRSLNVYTSPEIISFRNSILEVKEISAFLKNTQIDQDEYLNFSETASDIYALTTSLFISLYKRPPIFGSYPTQNDPMFSLLQQNPDDFWEIQALQKQEQEYINSQLLSIDQMEAFKDLIESGLVEEDYRININDWMNHEFWLDFKEDENDKKQEILQQ